MAEEKNLNLDEMYIAIGYGLNCDVRTGGIEAKGMESLVHSPMPRKNVVAELKKNITDCISNLDGYLAIRVTSHTADNNECVSFIVTDENPHQEDIELLFKRLEDGDADVVEIKPDDCTPNVYLLAPVVNNYVFANASASVWASRISSFSGSNMFKTSFSLDFLLWLYYTPHL